MGLERKDRGEPKKIFSKASLKVGFCMGLTFSTLGALASLLGLTFGFWLGPGLFGILGILAIFFGLQMLEVIHIRMKTHLLL